ncbi:hypothetical protein SAMN05444342_4384 [Haladaptatus paucihalophilus DX253]|uniref:Uncharacterized protein n=1 Tax=Haladaptatus paucihalophilus DX253 TaxID=797209 RepID=A0A1M7CKZ4_HALPU|nr:hypothetical protein SAMN05444342_4384 [Haladaptatus paucihalophilus DX253]
MKIRSYILKDNYYKTRRNYWMIIIYWLLQN